MATKPTPKTIANIITTYLKPISEHTSKAIDQIATADQIISLATFFDEKKINNQGLQKALELLADNPDKDIEDLLTTNNLLQNNDDSQLLEIVIKVINDNPTPVNDYKGGKEQTIGFLIGQCMKASQGSGNPQIFKELLVKELRV